MAKRKRRERDRTPAPTSDYRDAEGNVLTLRDTVSAGTVAKLREPVGGAAASADDIWRRRTVPSRTSSTGLATTCGR